LFCYHLKQCIGNFRWVIVFVLVLCACAPPVEEDIPPTRTRRPQAKPAATAIPTLLIALPRATFALDAEHWPAKAPITPAPSCFPPTLAAGLRLSASGSFTQTETEAAGPMLCRIERNSCAFRRLVGNLDPSVLFHLHKPPPYDTEDMLMHPAMLLPLTRLKELVAAEWGSEVKLMVTAAYDSLLEHDLAQADSSRKYSLHFEGRSLDLVTYPVDPSRYARLCALAHCAGFDFVENERDHCHASIKALSLCSVCSGKSVAVP
jgi:hypothetical protein